jgi:predicted DNA-binding antitoxin AbrB/MazE fold protein
MLLHSCYCCGKGSSTRSQTTDFTYGVCKECAKEAFVARGKATPHHLEEAWKAGGDGIPKHPEWISTVEKIKTQHDQQKLKFNGKCDICGAPCRHSGNVWQHHLCVECALKTYEIGAGSDWTEKREDVQRQLCEEYGGDEFGVSYDADVAKVKEEYQKKIMYNPYYHDCSKSPSVCQTVSNLKGAHDPSTIKEYQVNIFGKWERVKLCQAHYENRNSPEYGWGRYEFKGEVKFEDLKKGQRVQVELNIVPSKPETWATVLTEGSVPALYLDEVPPGFGWRPIIGGRSVEDAAKSLGLDLEKAACWNAASLNAKILQVGDSSPTPPKEDKLMPELSEFKTGQRIKVEHAGHHRWATVIVPYGSCQRSNNVALLHFDISHPEGWNDHSDTIDHIQSDKVIKNLGIEGGNFRYAGYSNTKVLEVAPEISLCDLQEGERIRVLLDNKHETWATVIYDPNKNNVIHVDDPKNGYYGADWDSEYAAAQKYGLETGKHFWGANSINTKILARGKRLTPVSQLKMADLKEGDRVEILSDGHQTWATVILVECNVPTLYYDTAKTTGSFTTWKTDGSLANQAYHVRAAWYGLNPDQPNFRNGYDTDIKILRRGAPIKQPSIPPLKMKDLQEGDRVEIETDGHRTWATVILKEGNSPILYFDVAKETGAYHTWAPSIDSTRQKAAERYGLDPSKPNCRRGYDDEIKILPRRTPITAVANLADLKDGERVKVKHLNHTSWATVVCPHNTTLSGSTLVFFDEEMKGDNISWALQSGWSGKGDDVKAAQNLGLDLNKSNYRWLTEEDTVVLERAPAINRSSLQEGDRVYLQHSGHYTWATVIKVEGNCPVVYMDNPSKDWRGREYWYDEDNSAIKFGLDPNKPNFWGMYNDNDCVIVSKGRRLEPIKPPEEKASEPQENKTINSEVVKSEETEKENDMSKYKVGEKLLIKIGGYGDKIKATVIEADSYGGHPLLWLEKEGYGVRATSKKHIETVQKLGLGRGYAQKCWTMSSSDKITRLEEENEKGEENMSKKDIKKLKVGDRIRIHAKEASYPFKGWGVVISLNGDDPLLYMDEEHDDTWSWDYDWQREAAIKAGKDPDLGCFWYLDTDSTILETEDKMEEKNFVGMVKSDATEAAYRVASKQMTKGVRAGLLRLFKDRGADDSKLKVIEELLDSEVGMSVISLLLGYGTAYIPGGLGEDPRVQKLSKEFRIEGMATAGNMVADTLMTYLAPAVLEGVSKLPPVGELAATAAEKTGIKKKTKKTPSVRIKTKEESKISEMQEEEKEESKEKTLSA